MCVLRLTAYLNGYFRGGTEKRLVFILWSKNENFDGIDRRTIDSVCRQTASAADYMDPVPVDTADCGST